MKKLVFSLSAAFMLGSGLVGCNVDDNAMNGDNRDNGVRPIGYYADEGTQDNDLRTGEGDNGNGVGMENRNNNGNNNDTGINNNGNGNGVGNNTGLNNGGNRDQAEKIADKVQRLKNIDDANVLITGDNVIVAVDTNDRVSNDLEGNIRNSVQNMAQGKDVQVVTDEGMFDRIGDVTDRLGANNGNGNGNGMDEVQSDIRGIIDDLGNAAQRPFEDNR